MPRVRKLEAKDLKTLQAFNLTEEDFQRFDSACHNAFNQIAQDLLECSGKRRLSRSEVIECTLDANRVEQYGEYGYRFTKEQPVEGKLTWQDFCKQKIEPILKEYGTAKFKALMKLVFEQPYYS